MMAIEVTEVDVELQCLRGGGSGQDTDERAYDRGWAWMVLLGTFMGVLLVNVWVVNCGQFFVEIQDITGCTATEAAWISTVNHITRNLLSPVSQWLCERWGHRAVVMAGGLVVVAARLAALFVRTLPMFTLTLGFMDGVGEALVYLPCIVFVSHYFKSKFGLATGCTMVGHSVAMLVSVRPTAWALEEFGLYGTILIHAGLSCHLCLAGALLFPNKAVKRITHRGTAEKDATKTRCQQLRTALPTSPVEILLIIGYSFGSLVGASLSKFLPPMARDFGVSVGSTSWMLTLTSVPDLIARLSSGFICDLRFVKTVIRRYRLYASSMIVMGVCYLVMPHLTDYTGLFVNSMFLSFGNGLHFTVASAAALELVGKTSYGRTFSFMMLGASLFSFTDVAVIAKLRDVTDSYNASFYFLAGISLAGAGCTLAQQLALRCRPVTVPE